MNGLVIVLFVLVLAAAIVWSLHAAAQRRKELAAWARARGLSFSSAHDRGLERRLPEFDCLRRGDSRYGFNVMSGQCAGRGFLGFDYHYATGSGKNRQTHVFSAVVLASTVPLRPLFIRPEGFFDRVTEFFGMDDIDFESAEFSRQFYVKSPDKRWAYDVLHPRAIEFLLSAPRFSIQFGTTAVIVWQDRRFRPEAFDQAAAVVRGLLEGLPEYVLQQQGQRL